MSRRRAVLLGLLSGMATALVAGALVVALAPETAGTAPSPPTPASSPSATVGGPSGVPESSGATAPSGPPGGPSGSPVASPSPLASVPLAGSFRLGEPAPALVVRQLGGGTVDLGKLRGHPVWIEFMATWCPSCRDEFPLMNGFAVRYASDGLVIVAVDVREDEASVAAFVAQLAATFPVGLDDDGKASAAWGAVGLPTHAFVDATGIIRYGAVGGIGPDIMAAGLRTIMPGVTVTP